MELFAIEPASPISFKIVLFHNVHLWNHSRPDSLAFALDHSGLFYLDIVGFHVLHDWDEPRFFEVAGQVTVGICANVLRANEPNVKMKVLFPLLIALIGIALHHKLLHPPGIVLLSIGSFTRYLLA